MSDGAAVEDTKATRDRDALLNRLAALKLRAVHIDRPSDKPLRRWLGDFLDQASVHGLLPLFNPWFYSADVMVPIVTLVQKAAWAPTPNVDITLPVVGQLEAPSNFVYDVQLIETVLGWVEGFLLVSFVTGLIAKE